MSNHAAYPSPIESTVCLHKSSPSDRAILAWEPAYLHPSKYDSICFAYHKHALSSPEAGGGRRKQAHVQGEASFLAFSIVTCGHTGQPIHF